MRGARRLTGACTCQVNFVQYVKKILYSNQTAGARRWNVSSITLEGTQPVIHETLDIAQYRSIIILTSLSAHHPLHGRTAARRLKAPSFAPTRGLKSTPRAGPSSTVSRRSLLRPRRSRSGQVRDAAPGSTRGAAHHRGVRRVRLLAPLVLPSASAVRARRAGRAVAQAPRASRREIVDFAVQQRLDERSLSWSELAERIERRFAITVHPRSIERCVVRAKKKLR